MFTDALFLTGQDPDHSQEEERLVTFGRASSGRILVVAYTERGERIRLISASVVTRVERKLYEEG